MNWVFEPTVKRLPFTLSFIVVVRRVSLRQGHCAVQIAKWQYGIHTADNIWNCMAAVVHHIERANFNCHITRPRRFSIARAAMVRQNFPTLDWADHHRPASETRGCAWDMHLSKHLIHQQQLEGNTSVRPGHEAQYDPLYSADEDREAHLSHTRRT